MNSFRAALCALLFAGAAFARPVVLEEVATLSPPPDRYMGQAWAASASPSMAISRWPPRSGAFQTHPRKAGSVYEVAAFIYQRSGTNWNYTGQLGPIVALYDRSTPGLAMKWAVEGELEGRPLMRRRPALPTTRISRANSPLSTQMTVTICS